MLATLEALKQLNMDNGGDWFSTRFAVSLDAKFWPFVYTDGQNFASAEAVTISGKRWFRIIGFDANGRMRAILGEWTNRSAMVRAFDKLLTVDVIPTEPGSLQT